jgi:hypothetical protein
MKRQSAEILRRVNGVREAAIVSLGIILVDSLARNDVANYVSASVDKKIEDALPSAFVAPRISDDIGLPSHNLDLALDVSAAATSTLLVKSTSSAKEMVAIGAAAQLASSTADAAVTGANLLSPAEMHQEDVGASAIESAFITKFLLDKMNEAESGTSKKLWAGAAGVFALAMTFGASYVDRKNGTLDFSSHTAGIGVGAIASYLKSNRSAETKPNYET